MGLSHPFLSKNYASHSQMKLLQPIHQVGICGIGQMGAAAAVCFKRAGYRVFLWARNPKKLDSVGRTLQTLETWMDLNVGPAAHPGETIRRLESLQTLDEKADLVMDCIAEDMEQKTQLLRQFPHCKARGAIFITTTSGLSITEMGRLSGCSHQLAGTHFWNPPHLMPLVEVVRGEDTPDRVIEQVCQLVKSLGKIPVKVQRDVPGFIGNRLLHALWREAIYLVERGIATPEDVDLVARFTFGLRMPAIGPLENMDLVGLDLIERIHQYLLADLADNHGPSEYLTKSTREGRLGVKSGEGFYDWGSRNAEQVIQKRDMQIVHQLSFLNELENNRQDGKAEPAERKGR